MINSFVTHASSFQRRLESIFIKIPLAILIHECLGFVLTKMDSSLRWNDSRKKIIRKVRVTVSAVARVAKKIERAKDRSNEAWGEGEASGGQ